MFTVTVTVVEVLVLPLASRATAVSAWLPLATPLVVQACVYGEAVSSAPRFVPSSLNWTPATPTLSVAVAFTSIVPLTVAPFAGDEMATVGAVVSAVTTAEACGEAAPTLPAASSAVTR